MNNRDLLKEAIADAKAVKETAIANAKAALEEAFTPYLKEKLAAKLSEMDEMDEAEDKKVAEMKHEKEMKENFDMDESKVDEYAEEQPSRDDDGDGEVDLDEMDLDELLRELDDMEEGEDLMEGEDDLINNRGGAGNLPKSPDMVEEEEGYEDEDADGIEDSEDEEVDLENMSEDDLKSFIESVIADMVASGELEGEVEGEEGEEEGEEESEEEEINIDELVAELKERKKYGGNKGDVPAAKRGDKKDTAEEEDVEDYKKKKLSEMYDIGAIAISDAEAIIASLSALIGVPAVAVVAAYAEDKIRGVKDLVKGKKAGAMKEDDMYEAEVDEMKEKLKEAYSTIETIKSDLNEVNLLNAKLLYTNKVFRAKNLTENQKVKVLEAFDKATTTKEAKLVFETLSGEVKERKSSVTESMIGGASKAAGIAPTKSPILEVNDQYARWQTLAGIKK
jgi:predicted transcriptional regulator